ncbi:MAG: AAA family ATPase [Oligoflexales bacterium]|nr:AAA family ATPase [Oligoflexales bacterium]
MVVSMIDEYLKFWNIEQPVFNRALGPGQVYLPPKYVRFWQHLLILCQQPHTLQLITGEHGRGKTVLARWVYHYLNPMAHESFIYSMARPEQEAGWLLPRLNEYLIGHASFKDSIWKATAKGFEQLREEKRHLILIIDVADYIINEKAMEDLLFLYNLNKMAGGGFTALLIGSSKIWELCKSIAAIKQKISFRWDVPALGRVELEAYIQWYLKEAKMTSNPFSDKSMDRLFQYSQGTASNVNSLAESCLIESSLADKRVVQPQMIENVAKLMGMELKKSEPNLSSPEVPRPQNQGLKTDLFDQPQATEEEQENRSSPTYSLFEES